MNDVIDRLGRALGERYRIERELGEGGMATVYLAEDRKHERKVALKVLKPDLAAVVGAERFLTEIKTTANLSHPHILPLHDSGEADGFLYYVMPYVAGESLRDRLERERQLPVDEAVRITSDIAEGLEHAHRHGVVHRDVKPANILLQDGRPLIADFGIALAVGAAGGTRLTETGLSLGTPYYMSPEQATGDSAVGPTSDIYAAGCVLYEMLVGEPPYPGATAQAALGKIIAGGPVSPAEKRATVPPNVDAAVRRALEKVPADRFRSAEAFADALHDASFRHGAGVVAGEEEVSRWRRRARLWAGAAAVTTLVAAGALLAPDPAVERPVTRLSLAMPEDQKLREDAQFVLAPDGSFLVYQGPADDADHRLWIRHFDQLDGRPLEGTEGAVYPAVSPDGRAIAFTTGGGTLAVTPVEGGVPRTLVESVRFGAGWSHDGEWLYYTEAPGGGLSRIRRSGGAPEVVTALDSASGHNNHLRPIALPGGTHLLLEVSTAADDSVGVVEIETGDVRTLVLGEWPGYSPTGHILYGLPASTRIQLLALPFDAETVEVTGSPVTVTEELVAPVAAWYFWTIAGRDRLLMMLARGEGLATRLWTPVWVERNGGTSVVDPEWSFFPGGNNRGIDISPDGSRVAVNVLEDSGAEDVWIKQLPRGPFSRLTTEPVEDVRPKWSADGRSIHYISRRGDDGDADAWSRRADGVGEPTLLLDLPTNIWEVEVDEAGGRILARIGGEQGLRGERDIVMVGPDDSVARPILESGFDEKAMALSADGRWLAYESDETGRNEIYVRPFPDVTGGKYPVSQGGGVMPVWAHGGNELFYVNGDERMIAARYEAEETFRVVELETLFELPDDFLFSQLEFYSLYDVTPDDERFIFYRAAAEGADPELVLVENWARALEAGDGGS